MRFLRQAFALLCLVGNCLVGAELGPRIGAVVPNFELPDQNRTSHSLRSLLGPKGAIILFFRSADWCAYCKSQIVELDRTRDEFTRLGLGVAAVSYDTSEALHTFAQRRGIHIPLLSDSESKVIREVGILNESIDKNDPAYGVPYPCSLVLDAEGVLAGKFFEDNHRRSYTFAAILSSSLGIKPASVDNELHGDHLTVTSAASDTIVTVGKRVSLTADIELEPGMHVYAAGAQDHIPIECKIVQSAALAGSEIQFPAPDQLRLRAFNEIVPAYRGRFRIRGTVTIADDESLRRAVDPAGYFWVEAPLRYQACDEETCYPPRQLVLKWRFQYAGFDRERMPPQLQRRGKAR